LNRVLANDCDAVELVETIPKRGSLEKVYRLKEDLWAGLSGVVKSDEADSHSLRALSPGVCFLEAVEALGEGTFDQLKGSAWEWFPATLDDKAWQAIRKARRAFNEQLDEAVEESRERGKKKAHKTRNVVVGVAAFPAAHPTAGS
jgi:hypothetical protein